MAAVTESIKVVLMRLNCRRYCRPLPPPIPLRFQRLPFSVQRLRRRFNPPFSFRIVGSPLHLALSLFPSRFPSCAINMHRDPSRHCYGFRSFPSTYDFESRQLPSLFPLPFP